jgi:hypothetical protein
MDGRINKTKNRQIAVFGCGLGPKTSGFRGRLVLFAVIFAAFNSEISGGRVNRCWDGGVELFEPDPGGARQLPTGREAW